MKNPHAVFPVDLHELPARDLDTTDAENGGVPELASDGDHVAGAEACPIPRLHLDDAELDPYDDGRIFEYLERGRFRFIRHRELLERFAWNVPWMILDRFRSYHEPRMIGELTCKAALTSRWDERNRTLELASFVGVKCPARNEKDVAPFQLRDLRTRGRTGAGKEGKRDREVSASRPVHARESAGRRSWKIPDWHGHARIERISAEQDREPRSKHSAVRPREISRQRRGRAGREHAKRSSNVRTPSRCVEQRR
jgi:hypothetical protein